MNATVEQSYCNAPITSESTGFLLKETYDFCSAHNPLFMARPEWLQVATCGHGNFFWIFYSLTFITTILDLWHIKPIRFSLTMFLGAKLYAVAFYYYMELTSDTPPNLVEFFGVEGSYAVSIGLVAYKLLTTNEAILVAVPVSASDGAIKAKAY
mmetsp:Transcript_34662/g.49203  ORF Transcript_34662/g.49203 Transcript_34662/m.49203 type:complete len:154 (+) Transcript_34662:3-464(+)